MTLSEFKSFVVQNTVWFQGVHPETTASLRAAEEQLGVPLPSTMKWLLSESGYSVPCGIDSLDETVKRTLFLRQSLRLEPRYVVLNDFNDAGVVYLDTAMANEEGECPVYWVATHNFERLAEGESMDEDLDVFEDYPTWVQYLLQEEIEENV